MHANALAETVDKGTGRACGETAIGYLNFSGVAETVAELIVQANARPISIGIAGAWGVGKSSMIQLVQHELDQRDPDGKKFLFVTFNA